MPKLIQQATRLFVCFGSLRVFLSSVVLWLSTVFEMNTEIMQQAVTASNLLLPLSDEEKPKVYPALPHLALLK